MPRSRSPGATARTVRSRSIRDRAEGHLRRSRKPKDHAWGNRIRSGVRGLSGTRGRRLERFRVECRADLRVHRCRQARRPARHRSGQRADCSAFRMRVARSSVLGSSSSVRPVAMVHGPLPGFETKDEGRGPDQGPSTSDEGQAATRKRKLLYSRLGAWTGDIATAARVAHSKAFAGMWRLNSTVSWIPIAMSPTAAPTRTQ